MSDTIIGALRDYFLQCPLMGNSKINVDYLPEKGVEYSIDTTPATEIIKQYLGGGSKRQYLFVVRSVVDYSQDTLQAMANSGFYEKLADFLETQTQKGIFPKLAANQEALKIEAQSTGYLFSTSPKSGKYQIQCRLIYMQKG